MTGQKPENIRQEAGLKNSFLYKGALFAYPLILLFVLENTKPSGGFFTLLTGQDGLFTGLMILMVNYLLVFSLVLLVYGLSKSMFAASVVVGGMLFLFYGVNYYRWLNTGYVFTPGDLVFAGRLDSLAAFASFKPKAGLLLSLVAVLLCSVFFFLHRNAYRNGAAGGKKRLAMILGSLGFIVLLLLPAGKTNLFKLLQIEASLSQYPERLYATKGGLLGFMLLVGAPPFEAPAAPEEPYQFDPAALQEGYNAARMEEVLAEIAATPIPPVNGVKPNVIVVMSEAFWDPARLPKAEFSAQPLPNYTRLAQENKSGNILTPALGGLTSNVEYELLLMDSMLFYQQGMVPFEAYRQMLPQEEDPLALPWQFKANGYRTVAVHPFAKNFYNRGVIYPRLGFDSFISQADMPGAPVRGTYISDEYFTQRLIEEIENTDEPLFLFGISMENHYPYDSHRYKDMDIQVTGSQLEPPDIGPLNTYTQGVHNADAALGQLVDYLESQKEPTLLLFYGDHLPIWEARPLNLYYTGGLVSSLMRDQWTLADNRAMYNTPYLLWSNYDPVLTEAEDFSPVFAGPMLLRAAGLEMSPHAAYLLESQTYFNGLHHQLYIDGRGNYLEDPPQEGGNRLNSLYYIHLDRFEQGRQFGRQHAVEGMATG